MKGMKNSLGSLDKDMDALRAELAEMKGQDKAANDELMVLGLKIQRTEEIVNQFKKQWRAQLDSHQVSANALVQQALQG